MISFAWPFALLALPLPLLVIWWLPRARDLGGRALRFPLDAALNAQIESSLRRPLQPRFAPGWRLVLASLAWVLLVLAAARPEWVGEPRGLPLWGRDLMLAIDVSGSMEQTDYELNGRMVSRIDLIKALGAHFIAQRTQDRIGLILFGSRAYLMTPLTFDRPTVATMLTESVVGLAGRETAIGDAIALAVKRLREEPAGESVLVLLTDGANNAGAIDPLTAAELAAQSGVRIYTIGIGGGMTRTYAPFGFSTQRPGRDFDPQVLQRIAEMTGGRFFSAHAREELEEIYAELDRLEPNERDQTRLRPRRALFIWPAAGAFILSLLIAAAGPRVWTDRSSAHDPD